MSAPALLADLNNPGRFEEIARRHRNAFDWRPQNRIPLGIHVVDPKHAEGLSYRDWLNPGPFLEFQTRVLADTLAVGSDLLAGSGPEPLRPVADHQHVWGRAIHAGGQLRDPSRHRPNAPAGSLWHRRSGFARNAGDGCRDHAGCGKNGPVLSQGPARMGPRRRAHARRSVLNRHGSARNGHHVGLGGPSRPLHSTDRRVPHALQANVENRIRQLTGASFDRHITNFGILGAGLRLGEDCIVNLSPSMIRRFALPAYDTVNNLCGGRGHIHFCSLPHSRFEHIHPVLAASFPSAGAQLAVRVRVLPSPSRRVARAFGHRVVLRRRVPLCAAKYGSFRDWAHTLCPQVQERVRIGALLSSRVRRRRAENCGLRGKRPTKNSVIHSSRYFFRG